MLQASVQDKAGAHIRNSYFISQYSAAKLCVSLFVNKRALCTLLTPVWYISRYLLLAWLCPRCCQPQKCDTGNWNSCVRWLAATLTWRELIEWAWRTRAMDVDYGCLSTVAITRTLSTSKGSTVRGSWKPRSATFQQSAFSQHIQTICTKARKILGLLYRRFYKNTSNEALLQLYISLVRPHLEYASPVWDIHLKKNIKQLEEVERFALKMITRQWNLGYQDLLELVELTPLQDRRVQSSLCTMFMDFAITFKTCYSKAKLQWKSK